MPPTLAEDSFTVPAAQGEEGGKIIKVYARCCSSAGVSKDNELSLAVFTALAFYLHRLQVTYIHIITWWRAYVLRASVHSDFATAAKAASHSLRFTTALGVMQGIMLGTFGGY